MSQGEISADTISENLDEVGTAGLASTFIAAALTGLGAIGVKIHPIVSGFLALFVGVLFYLIVAQRKKRAKRREEELVVRLRAELSIRLAKLSSIERTKEFDKIRAELIEEPLPGSKRKALERYLVADFEIREGVRDVEAIGAKAVEAHTTNKENEDLRAYILQLERDKEELQQEMNALKAKSTKVAFDRGFFGSVNDDSLSIEDALDALDHSDTNIVINAIRFLGEEKNAQEIKGEQLDHVLSILKKFAESQNNNLRKASLETIGKIGGQDAIQFLLYLARTPNDKDINSLIKSLSYLGDIHAADACLSLIYEFDGRDLDDDLMLINEMSERIDLALCDQKKLVNIIRMTPADWASPEGSGCKRREIKSRFSNVVLDDEQRANLLSFFENKVFKLLAKLPPETALGVVNDILLHIESISNRIELSELLLDMCLPSPEPKPWAEELLYQVLSSNVLDIQIIDVRGNVHGESYIPLKQRFTSGLQQSWASAFASNLSERLLPYAKEYIQHCITMIDATLTSEWPMYARDFYIGLEELFASMLRLDEQLYEFVFDATEELRVRAGDATWVIDPILAELEASNLTLSLDYVLNDLTEKIQSIDLNSTWLEGLEQFGNLFFQVSTTPVLIETSIETLLRESKQSNGLKQLIIETVLFEKEGTISETLIQCIGDELNATNSHTRFYAAFLCGSVYEEEEVSLPPSIIDSIRAISNNETSSLMERIISIVILSELGTISDIPALKKLLNSESSDYIAAATIAILNLDIDEGLSILVPTLEKMNADKLKEFFLLTDLTDFSVSDDGLSSSSIKTRLNEALIHCKNKSLSLIGQLRQLSTATTFQDAISQLEDLDIEALIDPVSSTYLKPLSHIKEIKSEQGITFLDHCLEKFSSIPVNKRGGLPALFKTLFDRLNELDSVNISETDLNPYTLLEVFVHDEFKEQTLQLYRSLFPWYFTFKPYFWPRGVVSKESTQTLLKWLVEEDWDSKAIVMTIIRGHGITQAVKPLLQIVDETFDTIVEDKASSKIEGLESFIESVVSFFLEIDDVRALNALIRYKETSVRNDDSLYSFSVHRTATSKIDSYLRSLENNLLPPNAEDYLDHMIKKMDQVSLDDECWPLLLIHDLPTSLRFLMKKVLSENSSTITKQVFDILGNWKTDTTFLGLLNDNQMLLEEYFEMLETVSAHDYLTDEGIDETVIETIAILLMNDFETNRVELVKHLHSMMNRSGLSKVFIEKLTAYYIQHEEDSINQILVDLLQRETDTEDRYGKRKLSIVRCLRQVGDSGVVGMLEDMLSDRELNDACRFEIYVALQQLNPAISRFDELASEVLDEYGANTQILELMLKVNKERTHDWVEELLKDISLENVAVFHLANFVSNDSKGLLFSYDKLHQFDRGRFIFAIPLAKTRDSRAVDYLATGLDSNQWYRVVQGLLHIRTKEAISIVVAEYERAFESGAVAKARQIGELLALIKDSSGKELLLESLSAPYVDNWGSSLYALLRLEDESTLPYIDTALSVLNKLPNWKKMEVLERISWSWSGHGVLGTFDQINPDFVRKLESSELFASFISSQEI